MSDHTPGPWRQQGELELTPNSRRLIYRVYKAEGQFAYIADVTTAANARLIAAAPDLLAACQSALYDANAGEPSDGRTIDALLAAIRQATGGE